MHNLICFDRPHGKDTEGFAKLRGRLRRFCRLNDPDDGDRDRRLWRRLL